MAAKKSLGQHFLTSERVIEKIIEAAALTHEDTVLEVGPGRGILTKALLSKAGRIIAVEKDGSLIENLEKLFQKEMASKKFILLHGDILDWKPKKYRLLAGSYKVVANIPYYITGIFLRQFLGAKEYPKSMTLLVQKEVADRIVAKDKKESLYSIGVKAYGIPKYEGTVRAGNFSPPPKVDSAILSINNISKSQFDTIDEEVFFTLVRAGFAHKRKQLAANLRSAFGNAFSPEETLPLCNIPPKARAENISLADWKCLVQQMKI
ncbi:MAG: 16S rRNA (adenine1518-N6/adenine1519-N6)-dimethyltransferase [Parcubacteria group bacterium Gr01-1014_48]|nr:MAG: 16S rRNA (adenine1518-N6/adenine1519-N6)-dimethyltransferase [Parcubacteria group bacterium Greene0416_14]TSC74104.1 MAG: 16S rRNA (adenine1518-N6/adenine1519-N6)-dimethyltransferase [Parcubacteria group bacterium Gr01-1014_48]TSD00126.1 MAG: 16S rRNA (adenine1518-N6/adenine1519-N6)-dimethyltransferase [Parcubacteria group bacterium Greene1014_15]TSD07706.1 MAG: 16S rRNA (adenine1518-N6/adenine1519-N6)-dimethyltransferase [Parcubacteria group bacterium Greene0714_4]